MTLLKQMRGSVGRKGWYQSSWPKVVLLVHIDLAKREILLNSIYAVNPGHGDGTKALLHLIDYSKSIGCSLALRALADKPEHQKKLERWYRKMGFAGPATRMVYATKNLHIARL